MKPDHRPLLIAALLVTGSAARADPAAGAWIEKTQEMAGGMALRRVQAQACYAPGQSGLQFHLDRLVQRHIDPSCTSESESRIDSTRYAVRCGGEAFGDGSAVVSSDSEQSIRISVVFHNHATGMDMEYFTDAAWKGAECHTP